jgi:hypothetical protein
LRTEKTFDSNKIWETFILDGTRLNTGERYALRLEFDRSLNNEEGEKGDMLKRLWNWGEQVFAAIPHNAFPFYNTPFIDGK